MFISNTPFIFLLTDCIWSHSPDFGRPKQSQKLFVPPFHIDFLNSECVRISWVLAQSFQGYPKSQPGVMGLASSTLQSQPIQKVVHFGVFRFYFDKTTFPGQTVNLCLQHVVIHILKAIVLAVNYQLLKHFLNILRGVTFLLTQQDAYVNSILHCVICAYISAYPHETAYMQNLHGQLYPKCLYVQNKACIIGQTSHNTTLSFFFCPSFSIILF